MVGRDGRVMILDFGLITDALPGAADAEERMAGTPPFLAPEQYAGAGPSEASDWYAVGVTLYQALTGRLPFDGSWQELRSLKSHSDPPPPASIEPEVPDDLNEICRGLLCRDPQRRLSGRDALDKLVDGEFRHTGRRRCDPRPPKPFFAGRARQLAILSEAFTGVRERRANAICVHGASGIGKTTLIERFLGQLPDDAVVLRGRCHQHESVAYEAVDGIIDSPISCDTAAPLRASRCTTNACARRWRRSCRLSRHATFMVRWCER
jgi:hypothetical protein